MLALSSLGYHGTQSLFMFYKMLVLASCRNHRSDEDLPPAAALTSWRDPYLIRLLPRPQITEHGYGGQSCLLYESSKVDADSVK